MNYNKLKISELREIAEEKGLRGMAGLKKAELVELLTNVDRMRGGSEASVSDGESNASDKHESQSADEKKSEKKSAKKNDSVKKESVKKETAKKSVKAKDAENKSLNAKDTVKKNAKKNSKEQNVDKKISEELPNSIDSEGSFSDGKVSEDTVTEDGGRDAYDAEGVYSEDIASADADSEDAFSDSDEAGNNKSSQNTKNEVAEGILEVMADGFGFIRSDNYMPGDKDIYVSPSQIRKFRLRTGDIVKGPIRKKMNPNEKFSALLYIDSVNGYSPSEIIKRKKFEDMTPIFPDERIHLDYTGAPVSLRIVDLFSPIGKGQRGMIVSPPKAGKTTLLKQIARRISVANPEMNLLVLLIDERPEEVTDIKEAIEGPNAEVIYSTFDELPEHHKRVSEMVIERAKRLVESGNDVVILIDSITRLARAYNLTVPPSGRTLSGGLDPAALHMPKKFFGAARNMREGGSLTILATALIDTGSRMDDVVFEEFKGTGNMELVLDRNLQEKRVFPAIDISKSGTRKDDLLLSDDEREVLELIHARFHSLKVEDVTEDLIKMFNKTKNNQQFIGIARKLFQPKR